LKRICLSSILLFTITGLIKGQNKTNYLPSVSLGSGILSFDGSINSNKPFTQINAGFNASIEEAINRYMGVSLNGLYGTLTYNQMGTNTQHLNFQSRIEQADLNVLLHLDKPISPYLSFGLGYMAFNPYGDLYDASGGKYNYWTDGTIRNLPQNSASAANAVQLTRDYKYETKLTDSATNYPRTTLVFPIALGINIKAFEQLTIRAGATYYFTATKWIDNVGKNYDSYIYANVSAIYHFGKEKSNDTLAKIEEEDRDGDGIKDLDDVCPGTPKTAKVDKTGCPIDTDKDGVPDYKDKEANTPPGTAVNEEGLTITPEMLAKRKEEFEMLASGKLKSYIESENTKMVEEKPVGEATADEKSNGKTQSGNSQVQSGNSQVQGGSNQPQGGTYPKNTAASVPNKTGTTVNNKPTTNSTITGSGTGNKSTASNTISNGAVSGSGNIPAELRMFDKNNDGKISSDEINIAIDDFFEGNPNITIAKLNQLIDFFFEQ